MLKELDRQINEIPQRIIRRYIYFYTLQIIQVQTVQTYVWEANAQFEIIQNIKRFSLRRK